MGNGWSPAASGAATELALGLEAVSIFDTNIFQGELPTPNSFRERVFGVRVADGAQGRPCAVIQAQ